MSKRQIVKIDESKCNGCGQCVSACHEGAIQVINGKAKLISDSYCDGLGACIGDCPLDAITIETREAAAFDEEVVKKRQAALKRPAAHACPGMALSESALSQWPVQLMLVPPTAPFLKNADLLICADCVPFVVSSFHQRYLSGRVVLVGCPKLDDIEYYHEKLTEIIDVAKPKSVTVLRMEVPCCSGIAQAVLSARDKVSKELSITVETIAIRDGRASQQKF